MASKPARVLLPKASSVGTLRSLVSGDRAKDDFANRIGGSKSPRSYPLVPDIGAFDTAAVMPLIQPRADCRGANHVKKTDANKLFLGHDQSMLRIVPKSYTARIWPS